ncbi:hypothetical protein [Lacihabitans lacunae]|uniref:Uncharacterized protein n=1 Tax=Lacihabitans lacunae TaxID=1028214 RepID=A0ABV7Z029_9BACT
MKLSDFKPIVVGFINHTLPKEDWTHQAHVMVAFWFNTQYPFEEAFAKIKAKIMAYNEAIGGLNTDTAGYHETITWFWMKYTKNYLLANIDLTLDEVCQKFLESENSLKELPLKYYSAELLASTKARKQRVEGDILVLNLKSK